MNCNSILKAKKASELVKVEYPFIVDSSNGHIITSFRLWGYGTLTCKQALKIFITNDGHFPMPLDYKGGNSFNGVTATKTVKLEEFNRWEGTK